MLAPVESVPGMGGWLVSKGLAANVNPPLPPFAMGSAMCWV